ncbi:hypothetical protein PVAP13_2KG583177 [Panicum virgatum]|uniref:Uncharacterized protein n=1 Tax=Panicum virgatum TaxID=38727 RepID=A0A8T0WNG0_PANVG|nr:hypothetical protein PVAP13_2KG583177 [Panicum virgatum]
MGSTEAIPNSIRFETAKRLFRGKGSVLYVGKFHTIRIFSNRSLVWVGFLLPRYFAAGYRRPQLSTVCPAASSRPHHGQASPYNQLRDPQQEDKEWRRRPPISRTETSEQRRH